MDSNNTAFTTIQETAATQSAPQKMAAGAVEYQEPGSAFAKGLPVWTIEPPQVMVRRKK